MSDAEWTVVRDAMPLPRWLEGRGGQPEGYSPPADGRRGALPGRGRHHLAGDACGLSRVGPRLRLLPALAGQGPARRVPRPAAGPGVREAAGRDPEPTARIIDAQSVKGAASVPAATRGFDGGKKINGRKRRIVVDALGPLLAILVSATSVTDRDAGRPCRPGCVNGTDASRWCGPTAATPDAWSTTPATSCGAC